MATVTTSPKAPPRPAAPPAAVPQAAETPVLDPLRPHYGDRIAFTIWVTCALFMAALLTYDTVMGLFR
jgi:hypothetical protein